MKDFPKRQNMALVFISHSSVDKEKTDEVFESLKKAGFDATFLDHDEEKGIKVGEEWEKRLYSEIKKAYAFVVLLSPSWIESKWCFVEYTQAKALGKEIIPVIIDHGKENEVYEWIDSHIQKCDLTQDKKALSRAIDRLQEIALKTQKGFDWDKDRPVYPGLISFEENDAAIFYGRESETREIIEELNKMHYKNSPKFLNIVAASGMGKSSLLKAGILPQLKKNYKDKWIVLDTLKPTKRPMDEFAKLVVRFLKKTDSYKLLFNNLMSKEYQDQLDDIIFDIENTREQKASILFPIDQAEEFYSVADKEEKERFFEILSYLLTQKDDFFTIWTLRADFLKEFQKDKSTTNIHKLESVYSLSPITKESIASIIKEPAKIGSIEVEDKLVERLKDDMQDTEALPLLAMMLHKLYVTFGEKEKKLTLKDYESFGKELADPKKRVSPLESIIQTIADEAIEKFKEDKTTLTALKNSFIPHLVRVNENQEYIKREALLEQIPKEAHKAIEELVKARLLIKKEKDGKTTLEISHEALIRKWRLLQEWLTDEKGFLLTKSKVETALKEWEANGKKNNALLSGLNLENVKVHRKRLSDNERKFVKLSIKYKKQKDREYKELLEKAETELVKARYNIGLAMVEKAKNLANEKVSLEANLVSYKALTLLNKKLDKSDVFSEAKNIIYNSKIYFSKFKIINTHEEYVSCITISKDGNRIVSGSGDNTVKIWDSKSGELLQILNGHEKQVNSVVISKDENRVVTSSDDSTIMIWDSKSGELLHTLKGHSWSVNSIAISNDGNRIISGATDHTVKIWDSKSGELLHTLKDHEVYVSSVAISEDGNRIVSGSGDNTVKIWDSKSGELLHTLKGHKKYVDCVAISKDGNRIVSGSKDCTIRIWDSRSGKLLQILKSHKISVSSIVISEDGNRIISGSPDRTVKIWDSKSGELLQTLKGHNESVRSVAISEDGNRIISCSNDSTIRIWVTKSEKLLQILNGHEKQVNSVVISEDGNIIISASRDNTIKIWNSKSVELLQTLKGHEKDVSSVAISKDGNRIVSGSGDNTVKIWDSRSGKLLNTLKGHNESVRSIAISNNRNMIVSGSFDHTIKIWNSRNGELQQTLKGHKGSIFSVVISKDGSRIVSGDHTIKVWDSKNRELLTTLKGHKDSICSIEISEDGNRIVSGSWDHTIRIWDSKSGNLLQILKGHKKFVHSVAISKDGSQIVSGSADNTIRICDSKSGKLLQTLKGHTSRVTSVAISPDGTKIISGSSDKTIRIWDIAKLNDKSFINKKIKELQNSLGMKLDGVMFVPLEEKEKQP